MQNYSNLFRSMAAILVVLPNFLFAGSWPAEKGKGFFQITTKFIRADAFYTPGGDVAPIPIVNDFTNSLYGEFGVGKKLSLIFNLGLYKHFAMNESVKVDVVSGGAPNRTPGQIIKTMGDSEIGVKMGLYKNFGFKLGGVLSLKIPTSEIRKSEVKRIFTNSQNNIVEKPVFAIPVGDDDYSLGISLSADYNIPNYPIEVSVSAGFKNRKRGPGTKNYSDVIQYGGKLGWAWTRMYFIFSGFGQLPLKNGALEKDTRYLAYGPQVYIRLFSKGGFVSGLESATFNQNTLSALAYKFGIYLQI